MRISTVEFSAATNEFSKNVGSISGKQLAATCSLEGALGAGI
jgi:hypothetical protein